MNQSNRSTTTMKNHDKWTVYADVVKSNISAAETGKALGLEIRKNRCRCPIHNGDDFNCSLSKSKPLFHCFVCGAKGDVFHLVQAVAGMPFIDALRWFNGTFNLGMDVDSSVDEKRLKKAKNAINRKRERQRFAEHLDRLNFDMYLAVMGAIFRLEEQRDQNRPRRYSDDWNDQFAEAVEMLPELKEYMTYFAIESTVVKS